MKTTATLFLALAASFPAPAADEPKGDLAKLQGSWTAKVGPNKDFPIALSIQGVAAEITFTRPNGDEVKLKGEIKVNDQASPKTLDWVKFTGPNGDDVPANLAIYKLEGDSWTVCGGGPGNDRPTKFEAGEGGPPTLNTWTRVKDRDAPKPEEKPIAGDLAKFQGSWAAKGGPDGDTTVAMTVKGNAVTARWPRGDGTEVEIKGELRVNDRADPKTIDFFGFKGAAGDALKDNLGIYALDGEKIKVCVGGPGNERPTEFKPGEGGPPTLLVFARKAD